VALPRSAIKQGGTYEFRWVDGEIHVGIITRISNDRKWIVLHKGKTSFTIYAREIIGLVAEP